MPTGGHHGGAIIHSTHGHSVSLWEVNYMPSTARGFRTGADGSRDFFLM